MKPPYRLKRLALFAALGGACVVALAACDVFAEAPEATQSGVLGAVSIHFKVCTSGEREGKPEGSCEGLGNSGEEAESDPSQVFVGFRVPAGTGAPATFDSSATGPHDRGPQLVFSHNAGYASELQRLDPAPAGQEWDGYVSGPVEYSTTEGEEQNFEATPAFTLPVGSGGAPFKGPFTYRVVIGGRQYYGGEPSGTEAIDCGASLTRGYETLNVDHSEGFRQICVDAPEEGSEENQLNSSSQLAVRSASVIPGAPVTATAGTSATVPFTFEYDGPAEPAASFTVTSSTTLSGATATPSVKTISASEADTAVEVTVAVPEGAGSGSYQVTLTATLPNGEALTGTATLATQAKAAPAPTPTLTPSCVVPTLAKHSEAQAKALLAAAHCALGNVAKRHSKKKRGSVISQSVKPGKTLGEGAKVSIVLSTGPKPHKRHKSHKKR